MKGETPLKKVTAVLAGAGDRGAHCYAPYAKENPWKLGFTGVAEPDRAKREAFAAEYGIAQERCYTDFDELFEQPRLADALLLCTGDRLHAAPARKAMEKGYHILLEKPMSTDPAECLALAEAAKGYDKTFILCFVLRYTEFFSSIKAVIDSGAIGAVNAILHLENIPLIDQVHAFTRGVFSETASACPIIIGHCCHDLDIISWYAGAKCAKVASFGGLTHFKSENAPPGAPERCLDGCAYSGDCPYYAPNYYLTEDTGWPTSTIGTDMSFEGRLEALTTGPYGRCVYRCGNDVADNQTVIMEFENGVTATFALYPFAGANARTMKIMGTKGEIRANMAINEFELYSHQTGSRQLFKIKPSRYKYGGGDHGIMEYFTGSVHSGGQGGLTSMESSLQSHLIAFAAEKSRLEGVCVDIGDYVKSLSR